jgi:hypothetical protein
MSDCNRTTQGGVGERIAAQRIIRISIDGSLHGYKEIGIVGTVGVHVTGRQVNGNRLTDRQVVNVIDAYGV